MGVFGVFTGRSSFIFCSLHLRLTDLGRKKLLYFQLDIDSVVFSLVLGICVMDAHLEFIQGAHTYFILMILQ